MQIGKVNDLKDKLIFLRGVKITQKLVGLLVGLLVGFGLIGLAYQQVLQAENEAVNTSEKMVAFESGIHEIQLDLLNARQSETEFYLKKYPIYLGKFDARLIVASQNLKNLTNMVKSEEELDVVTELGDALEIYRNNFIEAAQSYVEIGLNENTGLLLKLNTASKEIESVISKSNVAELDRLMLKVKQDVGDFIRFEDMKLHQVTNNEIEKLIDLTKRSSLSDVAKSNMLSGLISYQEAVNSIADQISLLVKQKRSVKTAGKNVDPLFKKMIDISNKIISDKREEASQKRSSITTFFIATIFIIAIAVSVSLFFLARSIIKPLRKLQETVIKVNDGDLQARAGLNRSDELGQLAQAFDKLLDERLASMAAAEKESEKLNESVISLIRAVSQLAQNKDLGVKIPVSEDITGAISDSLNLLAKETAKIMKEVQATSSQVAGVSSLVKRQSDIVITVADAERQEVESTAVMLEESVKAMNDIAADANKANSKAETTMKNTRQALQTVLSSVEGINSIRNTISETEKRIKRLGERSQEISGIVNLINSIAERTHILALNASMHAASAGEAGRGFAVVADEVQRLAENAREATSEISTVVNNIRVETADTVSIMNKVISQVAEGTQLANQAGKSMKLTQQATADLVSSVKMIADSSENQVKISKQLLDRARKIKESTEQTGRELIEQTRSTDELVRFSDDLVSIVSVFKLPDGHGLEDNVKKYEEDGIKEAV